MANLWVWNGPRHENWVDEQGTINGAVGKLRPTRYHDVSITFENVDIPNAHLYWEDTVSSDKRLTTFEILIVLIIGLG